MTRLSRAPLLLLIASPLVAQAPTPVVTAQVSGTGSLLQAVSVLDANHVWVSGHAATYAWSADGGASWHPSTVAGADSLQFRDLHAVSPSTAYLMAAGPGDKSGVWKTQDGGATWARQFTNTDAKAFYDCMAFWTPTTGFAFSDGVDRHLPIAETTDGEHWALLGPTPPAVEPGEGSFAASGTCAVTFGDGRAAITTGNGPVARVFLTDDRWHTWRSVNTPLVATEGAGATTIAVRDPRHFVVLGGTIGGKATGPRVARTSDGGQTWQLGGDLPFTGAVFGSAYAHVGKASVLVAVGPGGAAYSLDDGATWRPLHDGPYWSVGFGPDGRGWMVGPKGRITRVDWR